MSITPLPNSTAGAKVPPVYAAAEELSAYRLNSDAIEDLTSGNAVTIFLGQINAIAAMLETSIGALLEDGAVIAPQTEHLHAAAGAIRTLSILAAFSDEAGSHAQKLAIAEICAMERKAAQ